MTTTSRILLTAFRLSQLFTEHDIAHCFWGGCAVAAALGHPIRKIRDIDILIAPGQVNSASNLACSYLTMHVGCDHYSKPARYTALATNDGFGVQLFSDEFIILGEDGNGLGCPNLHLAIDEAHCQPIRSLFDRTPNLTLQIPTISDLIITKLVMPLTDEHLADLAMLTVTQTPSFDALRDSVIRFRFPKRLNAEIYLNLENVITLWTNSIWCQWSFPTCLRELYNFLGTEGQVCR